jgi:ParB-like chromosome segregation protein Spo0J
MTMLTEAFDRDLLQLPLDRLLPSRSLGKDVPRSRKFEQIRVSMQEVGLIEPLSVTQPDARSGLCMVLDGHLRLAAARDLGWREVACLCSRDDEGYTYNKRVNRLATVQEHFMILRALERGVSEERLARTLSVDIETIRRKRDLLAGICPEAVELLKEAHFHREVMRHLRKMKPARQVECIELMLSVNNFSATYAEALLAATPAAQLVDPGQPKKVRGLSMEQIARMEQEMSLVQSRFKAIEQSYNRNVMQLVLARGYVAKLLGNDAVARWLGRHQPEVRDEFRAIVSAATLDEEPSR